MSMRAMTVVITTSRERAVFKDMNGGPCIRVRKGGYVRVDSADAFSTLWNSWTTVARARILAVCVSAHREPVLVGISPSLRVRFRSGKQIRMSLHGSGPGAPRENSLR